MSRELFFVVMVSTVMAATTLAGCASHTSAYYAAIDINVALKEGDRRVAACTKEFEDKNSSLVQEIDQILIKGAADPKRLEKLMNKQQLTTDQKRRALALWNTYPCRSQWLLEMSRVAKPQAIAWSEYFAALDVLRIKLIQDEVSIGGFNQGKLALDTLRDKNVYAAKLQMDDALNKEHYQELNARAQASQAAAAYMSAINSVSASNSSPVRSMSCSVLNDRINCLSF
jgi:hypothetical protein